MSDLTLRSEKLSVLPKRYETALFSNNSLNINVNLNFATVAQTNVNAQTIGVNFGGDQNAWLNNFLNSGQSN